MSSIFGNGEIILLENNGVGTQTISINTPSISSSFTLTLPDRIGSSNQILGSGTTPGILEWVSVGLSWKKPVKATSISDTVLSPAPATLDGVTINTNDRVLLKDQTLSSENGIYIKNGSGDFIRSVDAQSTEDASGTFVYTTDGTNQDKIFYCTDPVGTLFDGGITFETFNINNVVTGPISSTDNAIARYDGISGNVLKDSSVLVDNLGNIIAQIGDFDIDSGNINLNFTSQQDITHIGAIGQDLIISSTSGNVSINEVQFKDKQIIFVETGGGSNTITLSAPPNITPSSYTLTFPVDVGNPNQFLSTGTSTPGTMEWIDQTSGSLPGAPDASVQYNEGGGSMGGSSNFSWNNGSQILTLNGSSTGITDFTMSGNLTNSAGNINLTSTSAQNITHTGGSGNFTIESTSGNVLIENVVLDSGAVSNVTDIDMTGSLTNSAGDINLTSTSAQNITHTGGSGNFTIESTSGNVLIENVVLDSGAVSGVSTLNMSGNLTNSAGDIILSNINSVGITHTGQSGQNLNITSISGNVLIENITINSGAMSGVSTLDMSGNLTTSGSINLTSASAQTITHTGPGQDLIISSGSDIIVDGVTISGDVITGVLSSTVAGDVSLSSGNILMSNTTIQNITHIGGSGNFTIESISGNVLIETTTINGDIITGISNISGNGDINLTSTSTQNITHTGGLGDFSITSGSSLVVDNIFINNGDISNVTTVDMSGDLNITTNDINLTSTSSQNITHTGGPGQDLTISSGGNVIIDGVIFNNNSITAPGTIRTGTNFVIEDEGGGTNTITLEANSLSGNTLITLPPNNGSNGQLLRTDGAGITTWVTNPSSVSGTNNSIQFNNLTNFDGDNDLKWDDTSKILSIQGKTIIAPGSISGTSGLNGSVIDVRTQTLTDNTGGPTTFAVFNSVAQPILSSTVSITTTNATTVYVENAPLAGTNQTVTNSYALWVDNDDTKFDGNIFIGGQVDSTGIVQGVTLTDGIMSISSGDMTGIISTTATTVNLTTLSDGIASLNSGILTSLIDPTNDTDAANKGYVDSLTQGVNWKDSVKLTTEGLNDNKVLSGEQTIDGVAAEDGDRVLLKDQWLPRQNGIWIVRLGAWERAPDLDEGDSASTAAVLVEQGNDSAGAGFVCNNSSGSDTVGNDAGTTGDDLFFVQFSGTGSIVAGNGLDKIGNTLSAKIDNTTTEIVNDAIKIKDLGISTAKIADNQITTIKINDNDVTNNKLVNESITITAGVGLQNAGLLALGGTIIIDVDNTLLRTTGNQSVSGMQNYSNSNTSTSTTTGAVIIDGGLGVAKNIYGGGNLPSSGSISSVTSSSISDGTATLTAGNFTGLVSVSATTITSSGTIEGITLTNGTASMTTGSFLNINDITATGVITTSGSITDGNAILSGGTLTGLLAPTLATDAANKNYVDGLNVTAGSGLTKSVNTMNVNSNNVTIEVNISNNLQVKNSSIITSKLAANSVTTTKLVDNTITNSKLLNKSITITAGDGLDNLPVDGIVSLGNSITFSVDNTLLKTTGTNNASGIQRFTNTTSSTDTNTGSITTDGGIGIDKNINVGGNVTASSGTITSSLFTDGFAQLTGGNFTGLQNITATGGNVVVSGTVQGVTLTDNTASITLGTINSLVDLTSTGIITGVSFSDGIATLSGGTLSGLLVPTNGTDATNKAYVDGLVFGIEWKDPVRVGTTGSNIALTGLQTIDGVSIADSDRILVKDQTNKVNNGIYDANTGAWSRSSDMSSGSAENFATLVEEGIVNIGFSYVVVETAPFTINTSNLTWIQFAASGIANAGDALDKVGAVLNVLVDSTTIDIASNELILANNSVTTSKIVDSNITQAKIIDGDVTNSKLQFDNITVTAGTGLQNGGTVSLGSSVTIDVDNTVLRTFGFQEATEIQNFDNTTQSTNSITGSVVVTGGIGVGENLYGGEDITSSSTITGSSLTNSTGTISSGNFTGLTTIGCTTISNTNEVIGVSISDGVATINSGNFTSVGNMTATGTITTTANIDSGPATLSGGILSGLINPTSNDEMANVGYVDTVEVTADQAVEKTGTQLSMLVDDDTIVISLNKLQLKDNGISTSKLATDAIITNSIKNNNVLNDHILNDTVTFSPTNGLKTGGVIPLGGNVILEVDNTIVMRTSGTNEASGAQIFNNTDEATDQNNGAILVGTGIDGGIGIGNNINVGIDIDCEEFKGSLIRDSTGANRIEIQSDNITGFGTSSITTTTFDASNQIQADTIRDKQTVPGPATLTSGSFTDIDNLTSSGIFTLSSAPDDRVLFIDNTGVVTTSASLTWDGSVLSATEIRAQNVDRPNPSNQSSLWTSGTGDINFGTSVTGIIAMGDGTGSSPTYQYMFKIQSTNSILKSSLTVQENLSRSYGLSNISGAAVTYSTTDIYGGLILRDCSSADKIDNLPTAASLVTEVEDCTIGSTIEVLIRNVSTDLSLLTVTSDASITMDEDIQISAGSVNRFLIFFDNVTATTEAATVFASVPKDRVFIQCSFSNVATAPTTRYAQWGPEGDVNAIDYQVIGYPGKIVRLVCNYSRQDGLNQWIRLEGADSLSFSLGLTNTTLSTFTPTFDTTDDGLDLVVWDVAGGFNETYPSTATGLLNLPTSATDRISLRSVENNTVRPTSSEVRCAISFEIS